MTFSAFLPAAPASLPLAVATALALGAAPASAADSAGPTDASLTEIVVYAPYGADLQRNRVPARVQTAAANEIDSLLPQDITELLNRGFGGVSINHAQNNPLQPDVNFRGFTASPLLGLPQGIAVFANGMRVNEAFGDSVNWDLLPLSAIDSVQLLGGAHPMFGLNALGGALSLRLRNGFTFEGPGAEIQGGSFGRYSGSAQYGANNGQWGWYGNVDYFNEDGWRDHSPTEALRAYGVLSRRSEVSSLDLSVSLADTELAGNGASPAELLALDRRQVFTHPDLTENRLLQFALEGSRDLTPNLRLAGNAYYRNLRTNSFNGDGTIFEECEFGDDEFLVREDFEDLDDDGECNGAFDDDIRIVLDAAGNPVEAELDDEELDAINNIGRRRQESYGSSLQLSHRFEIAPGRRNDFTVGASFGRGETAYDSVVEVAQLLDNRATSRTGIFADEFRTNVDSDVETSSLYVMDTFDLDERVSLTLAGRYDRTAVKLADRSGQAPELNGNHRFERFNPAMGLAFRVNPAMTLYGNIAQSSRAPTAVELACADENAPCNLPNAFLADPPLDEVVARSAELGARGRSAGVDWQLGAFLTTNRNDILFQTVGGAQANVGFFDNVSDTRRAGFELSLAQRLARVAWSFDYSFVKATYEKDFIVNSPNHPLFGDDADAGDPGAGLIVGDDKLLVTAGSHIPGIARHNANASVDLLLGARLRVGADVVYRSGVYLRGDEINVLGRTGDYAVVNLRAQWRFNDSLSMFARVENLFDKDYETFGLLGEPDEVFADFEDPRFFGAGPPRGVWVGLRLVPGAR